GDNQLKPDEKKAIIAYVQAMKADKDPGGNGLGRTGPVPEGLVVFLVGIGALLVATVWIAGKS
ncbi:MAG: cytochrome C, partial [Mycobacteriales bacterium]